MIPWYHAFCFVWPSHIRPGVDLFCFSLAFQCHRLVYHLQVMIDPFAFSTSEGMSPDISERAQHIPALRFLFRCKQLPQQWAYGPCCPRLLENQCNAVSTKFSDQILFLKVSHYFTKGFIKLQRAGQSVKVWSVTEAREIGKTPWRTLKSFNLWIALSTCICIAAMRSVCVHAL